MIMQNLNQAVRIHINSEKTLLICTTLTKKHKALKIDVNDFSLILNLFRQLFNVYNLLAD
jgi:hypothetical protein